MTHPPHPPSEMVEAVAQVLRDLADGKLPVSEKAEWHELAPPFIRTVFAHVDRAAMAREMKPTLDQYSIHIRGPGEPCTVVDDQNDIAVFTGGFDECQVELWQIGIDAALAAALAAALPGDAEKQR